MKRNMVVEPLANEKGVALVVGLLLVAVLAILGFTALTNSNTELKISSNQTLSERAFYAAEAGAEAGLNSLRSLTKSGSAANIAPPTNINGFNFTTTDYVKAIASPSNGSRTLPATSKYAGLSSFCQRYQITSTANSTTSNTSATVVYEVEEQLIPLFQFGIFYDGRLEMQPGANMTFTNGRIHSNGDIYMQTSATLSIDTNVTAAGKIYNKRGDTGVVTGNNTVQIKGADGIYHGLNFGSDSSNWKSNATSTWGGTVQSSDHGITGLTLPLSTTSSDPYTILGNGASSDAGSLYNQSGLRIINGVAYDKAGNVLNLAAGGNNPITVTSSAFTDQRESKAMSVVQVDVAKLQTNTVAMAALNNPPAGCDSGILYVSSDNISNPSVRLVNGGTLTSGLSVATDTPLYIQGNYNTSNSFPSAIYSDAVTVLSNNWSDSNSAKTISNRTASATTVNAAIMTGNVPTSGSNYSGGVENFIRFLESWSGKTFTYGGSLTCLWSSRKATAKWPSTGAVYNAPNRNWSYNIDVANLPPGTPRVRNVERISWRQVNN
ncbi:MAG: hypothetical protein A4E66_01438 [Syntrophus sp. PtaB.Bin001]|nr:MAG: hypothetical protein A4E66_01438 [Syntrophus sp. PtaB.Bin001]